jgi:hypothetical protein
MQEFDAKFDISRKSNAINVCIVTEFFFIIKLSCNVMKVMTAAWWRQWQVGNTGGGGGGGGGMVAVAVWEAWWQHGDGQS